MVAGFYPRTDVMFIDPELHAKRCSFISCVAHLVCRCTTERDIKTDALAVAINNLISEVESVTGSGENTERIAISCTRGGAVVNSQLGILYLS
jgi:hypothetical protein